MAQRVRVVLGAAERAQLTAIAAERNQPRKHVERPHCARFGGSAHGAAEPAPEKAGVTRSIGGSRPTVWRWQQRLAESGIEGLLRDKNRKPGKAPIAEEIAARVVALTGAEPPYQATHWTGRTMAKASGISLGSVQRRGVFPIVDLQAAINAYLAEHNASPKPFVCTQSPAAIMAKSDHPPYHPIESEHQHAEAARDPFQSPEN